MKNTIIFAPHADDEIIGCWSLLNAGKVSDVLYFFDLNDERKREALKAAEYFGFNAHFQELFSPLKTSLVWGKKILLPSIKDNHEHHKTINRHYRSFSSDIKYYSVDLEACRNRVVLSEKDHIKKYQALNNLYPSQKALWENNASYYLFENIVDSDIQVSTVYNVEVHTNYTVYGKLETELSTAKVTCDKLVTGVWLSLENLLDHLIKTNNMPFKVEFKGKEYSA